MFPRLVENDLQFRYRVGWEDIKWRIRRHFKSVSVFFKLTVGRQSTEVALAPHMKLFRGLNLGALENYFRSEFLSCLDREQHSNS